MTIDILRRTGGWCVELQYPLKSHAGEIKAVEIRKPTADASIRWGQWEIPSTLALLSELCGIPERVLRMLPSDDFDRVIFAMMNVVSGQIKKDMHEGNRPLATPMEDLPEQDVIPPPDQEDPRFPAADGPVVRIPKAQDIQAPEPDAGDASSMSVAAPLTMTPVH